LLAVTFNICLAFK